jgi:6,7-dimethyl-8-ribityllumazine synthase
MDPSSAMQTLEGNLDASGRSFGIVVSRFNGLVTQQLLSGALDCLRRHGADESKIRVARCPGSFEIPFVARELSRSGLVEAVICLGCLIRGETAHFEYIAMEVTRGIGQVSLETGVPVSFGVLTTDTLEQALERAGAKAGNKGWDAAMSAIELLDLSRKITSTTK